MTLSPPRTVSSPLLAFGFWGESAASAITRFQVRALFAFLAIISDLGEIGRSDRGGVNSEFLAVDPQRCGFAFKLLVDLLEAVEFNTDSGLRSRGRVAVRRWCK